VTLTDVAPKAKDKLGYIYDFGDSWEHKLVVEAIVPRDESQTYPICIDGGGAAPPEDCGGVWGYANLVAALSDPNHPEHEDMLDWFGEEIDPNAFDLAHVNQRIANRYVYDEE
jgi:hypothetical protein